MASIAVAGQIPASASWNVRHVATRRAGVAGSSVRSADRTPATYVEAELAVPDECAFMQEIWPGTRALHDGAARPPRDATSFHPAPKRAATGFFGTCSMGQLAMIACGRLAIDKSHCRTAEIGAAKALLLPGGCGRSRMLMAEFARQRRAAAFRGVS